MTQDTLFDVCAGKHGGNPESKAANLRAQPGKLGMIAAIHQLLVLLPGGATCKEIAVLLNRPMHAISGRLAEMKAAGTIQPANERRDGGMVVRLT